MEKLPEPVLVWLIEGEPVLLFPERPWSLDPNDVRCVAYGREGTFGADPSSRIVRSRNAPREVAEELVRAAELREGVPLRRVGRQHPNHARARRDAQWAQLRGGFEEV